MSPTRQARKSRLRRALTTAVLVVAAVTALPAAASAHGPVSPTATAYLARIESVPAGIRAKIVDGYVRMWMRVPPRATVYVPDYEGADYLRFDPSGVYVNHNSTMYYLNEVPQAATPPSDLRRTTPPRWERVTSGHAWEWHDGRLQALAGIRIARGERNLGNWTVPLIIDGRPAKISGRLDHTSAPSILWFWPIVVLLACTLAAFRLRDPALDRRLLYGLGLMTLAATAVAAVARGLHGRPGLSAFSVVEMALVLAACGWATLRVLAQGQGVVVHFAVAFLAIWEGPNLLTSLLRNYVLLALPAFPSRAAATLCLGGGLSLLLVVFRLARGAAPPDGRGRQPASHRTSRETPSTVG